MSQAGFGCLGDGGWYDLEGFSFSLKGRDGQCVLIPEGLLHPEWGNSPDNTLGVKIRISAHGNAGGSGQKIESVAQFSTDLKLLHDLLAGVEQILSGAANCFDVPGPELYGTPGIAFQCRIYRDQQSETGWTIFCRSCTPHLWRHADSPGDSNPRYLGEYEATVAASFPFDYDCLEGVRSDLAHFLRWLGSSAP